MKEILEKYGFQYHGMCQVCNGKAELWKKGNVEVKAKVQQMRFILKIKGQTIHGKSSDLEATLEKYIPQVAA